MPVFGFSILDAGYLILDARNLSLRQGMAYATELLVFSIFFQILFIKISPLTNALLNKEVECVR